MLHICKWLHWPKYIKFRTPFCCFRCRCTCSKTFTVTFELVIMDSMYLPSSHFTSKTYIDCHAFPCVSELRIRENWTDTEMYRTQKAWAECVRNRQSLCSWLLVHLCCFLCNIYWNYAIFILVMVLAKVHQQLLSTATWFDSFARILAVYCTYLAIYSHYIHAI